MTIERRDTASDARGMSRRRLLGAAATAAAAGTIARSPARAAAAPAPTPGVMIATVTNSALRTVVGASAPGLAKVRAWPSANPAAAIESPWQATNAANAAKFVQPGAAPPGQPWSWQGFVAPPGNQAAAVAGPVSTVPQRPAPGSTTPFTFAFGSCILEDTPAPALSVVAASGARFFTLLGDLGYPDEAPMEQSYATYAQFFQNLLNSAAMKPVLSRMPFYGMQDDHDYGRDDCYADTVEAFAAQAYRDLVPGCEYPGVSYRRWSVGIADFFLLDNRRHRDPATPPFENGRYPSRIRSAQRAWLMNGLASSKRRLKVVFAPMTFTWYWGNAEKAELVEAIRTTVSGTVLLCTGDKHACAVARPATKIWEVLAGPINNPIKHKTPPQPGVLWTENGAGPSLSNCVGLVDVSASTVTARIVREDGVELRRQSIPI